MIEVFSLEKKSKKKKREKMPETEEERRIRKEAKRRRREKEKLGKLRKFVKIRFRPFFSPFFAKKGLCIFFVLTTV